MRFQIGDMVKVIKKHERSRLYWNPLMTETIGRVYKVKRVSYLGNYLLDTAQDAGRTFLYEEGSLRQVSEAGEQLKFSFMEE